MEILLDFFSKGLVTMLMIAMPCVLTAAGIGLIVGVLQAVTQVQEQTIAAAPKIFFVFLILMIMGVGFIRLLTNLFKEGVSIAFNTVPRMETKVLASDYYRYTKPFTAEFYAENRGKNNMNAMINSSATPNFSKQQERLKYHKSQRGDTPVPSLMEKQKIRDNAGR
ncbi:flagellar biosynthetic protein FliQ [bacterium]|nr:flagellar biosynthetic protein FliQ [bacterium]